jgi:hypothetical protein
MSPRQEREERARSSDPASYVLALEQLQALLLVLRKVPDRLLERATAALAPNFAQLYTLVVKVAKYYVKTPEFSSIWGHKQGNVITLNFFVEKIVKVARYYN